MRFLHEGGDIPLIKKPAFHISIGNHAAFPFPKPPVPVAGNPFIKRLADKAGNNDKSIQHFSRPVQVFGNTDSCPGIGKSFSFVNQYYGINCFRYIKFFSEYFSYFRLQRGKSYFSFLVIPYGKIYHPVTEITNAVKKKNRFINHCLQI